MFERVRAGYVEKPDDAKLIEASINGMLTALDPHSRYMNEKAWRDMQETTSGEFGGLGIEVTMEDGLVKVVAPMDDTPAAKAGIMSGDLITAIDDAAVQGLTLEQAVDKMKGPINTKTRLKILRKGAEQPIEISIMREVIRVRPVRYHADGGDIGYIRITTFNEQTTEGLKKAIPTSEPDPAGEAGRLRRRPAQQSGRLARSGGFGVQRVHGARRGRLDAGPHAEETQRFTARAGDLTKGKPLVVLINGGSASASEIVAGALHDHKRATLIGTRSFGKGSVQTIIPLGAGKGAMALTTARYFTPSGRSIQAKGIMPDIEVLQDVPDELKGRADTKGEASIRGHLSAEGAEQTGSQSYVRRWRRTTRRWARPTIFCAASRSMRTCQVSQAGDSELNAERPGLIPVNSGDMYPGIFVLDRDRGSIAHLTEMGNHRVGSGYSRDCPDLQRPPSRTRLGNRPPVQRSEIAR